MIEFSAFDAVQMRVGTIIAAEPLPEARKPAYKLTIEFGGELGIKRSSAQITELYSPSELVGRQIVAVVNFAPKRIAGFLSEVLVLGVPDEQNRVVLLSPDRPIENGVRIF